jgi:Skp family chaperone for outer membrane proteins
LTASQTVSEAKKEEAKGLQGIMSDPTKTDEEIAAAAADLKKVEKDLADIGDEAKKVLGKKSDEQMVILYKDIQSVAERYAKAHDIELVLHWNEATTEEDLFSPLNVARKMQAGTCMPVYVAPGMDISKEVVAILNDK